MKGGEELELPPGFRFHPTDEELVNYYLTAKCAGLPISVPVIADIDLYKYDPWQLPEMSVYGEKEWYFFSPRDRKYPKGSRPNRAAGSGYWKATGADKPIGTMGIKKSLVFYAGKPPRGVKTNWIMHEYRPVNPHTSSSVPKENNLRLDDWVLCRVYNKKGRIEKHYPFQMEPHEIHTDTSSESKPWLQTTDSSCSDHVLSPEDTKELLSQPNWILNDAFDEFQLHYNGAQDDPFAHQFGYQMDQSWPLQTMGIP